MKLNAETELKVGAFVTLGVILLLVSILMMGDVKTLFSPSLTYFTRLPTSDGLLPGAKVVVGGLNVGNVEDIDIVGETGEVQVKFKVERKHSKWIKADSVTELQTQGMLGDKFLVVKMGALDAPPLAEDSVIPSLPPKSLSDMLPKADQLMVSLNSIAKNLDQIIGSFERETRGGKIFANMATTSKNLAEASSKFNAEMEGVKIKKSTEQLSQILEKINQGKGTLGALINDPSLYDEAKNLVGGVNRNRVLRNIVRKTVNDGAEAESEAEDKK